MIDIKEMSQFELYALIHVIPLDFVMPALKENPKIFNRLFPGSMIKKLTEKKFHNSFRMNWKDDFVQDVIKQYLAEMKLAVEHRQNELKEEGCNENDSFIMAFSEIIIPSVYGVYLKYYEISYDDNFLSAINCYNNAVNKCKELEQTIVGLNEATTEQNSLKERIKGLEEDQKTIEEEKKFLNDELAKAHLELDDVREKLSESRSKQAYAEGREIPKEKEYIYSGDFPFLSLCKVINYGDEIRLKRLCDIYGNMMEIFVRDETEYYYDRLYRKNGPSTIGRYGVWNWIVTENYKDPSKDYVYTSYNEECQPISIIICHTVYSLADLLKILKEGINATPITRKVMFAVQRDKDTFEAILCEDSEIISRNGIIKLNEDIVRVKKYIIARSEVIEPENEVFFYKNLTMPITGVYVSVDNALEIIKKIILDKATRNVASLNKVGRKDRDSFRNMVMAIPTDDVLCEIMEKCMCDEEEAKRLISELEQNAEHLIKGDDISSEILTAIVNNDTELMVKCEALVEEKWRNENQRLIDGAQTRLQLIKNECDKKQKEADDLELQLSTVKAEISDYQNSIKEKEKLAADVETKIKKKIEDARNNAADFIAEMSFVSPMQAAYNKPKIETIDVIKGSVISEDAEIIEYQSAKELLDIIVFDNLADAGLDDKEINKAFSAFLYSAHIQKIPIILAGPNGMDIVNAYSVSLSGKEADVFDCSVNYSNEALQKLVDNDSKVTAVKNIINSEWITHIADIIKAKSFIVFICPFAEDLIIEPKSLYNYAVPVFTELLVSSASKEITITGQASSSYNEFDFQGENNDRIKHSIKSRLAKNMRASALLINKLSDLLTGVYSLCSSESSERIIETICGCIPYLYVSQNTDKIMDLLDAYEDIPAEKRKQITDLIGADNE